MRLINIVLGLAVASLALACGARAQPGESNSIGLRAVELANAIGVFEALPSDRVDVRHIGSGLRCRFEEGELIILPGRPRGEWVGCIFSRAGAVGVFAARDTPPRSIAEALRNHSRAVQQDAELIQQLDCSTHVSITNIDLPPSADECFLLRETARSFRFARASDTIIEGWHITMTYQGSITAAEIPYERASELNILAAAIWDQILRDALPAEGNQ
jgi:hypothetical protein